MRLILVRHGDWQRGTWDPPLNPEGEEQVRRLIKKLEKLPIRVIYFSLRFRTRQTVDIIVQALKKEIALVPLQELSDFDTSDINREDAQKAFEPGQSFTKLWLEGKLPRAESISDFQIRNRKVFDQITQAHSGDEAILVVTHRENIWAFLSRHLKKDFREVAKTHDIPYATMTILTIPC